MPPHARRGASLVMVLSLAGSANAQTASSSLSSLEAGYGGARAIETTRFSPTTRDTQGNRLVLNGRLQQGQANSSFVSGGAASSGSGADFFASGASATAVGNLLTVTVTGSGNTLIIDSQQANTGAVTAKANSGAGATSSEAKR
ncbi:holdfast anchoring protein HfaA [uncultured Caulobacter sp.]|uniref:holdfast anchoring protein HfaA n=1 Tax=uncultured Caulobacter sp. TaxID=158749 RepID=UPI00261619CA|nr:holdfast anchoring protein HfaA [uncultured Caulobacter sp.]